MSTADGMINDDHDGRVLFCWLSERRSERGETYYVGTGIGAVKLLMIRGQEQRKDLKGRPVWKVYAIPRDDIADIAPDSRPKKRVFPHTGQ